MKRLLSVLVSGGALLLLSAAPLLAQTVDGLGDAILDLNRDAISATQQRIADQLYSGRITATIFDNNGNNGNFADTDVVAFIIEPVSGDQRPLTFGGTRAQFDTWVNDNAAALLAILFPGSLVEGASGIDAAHSHSQGFLLSTALAVGERPDIGGRIEYERFEVEGAPGNAVQGLFKAKAFAAEARFAQLDDTIRTRSTTFGVNVNPSWGPATSGTSWRVGVDGYFSAMYSTSRSLDLGSLDYGGGFWGSAGRDINRVSFNLGGLLLASDTYIPLRMIDDGFQFVAEAVNDRSLRWDLTYGGTLQYSVSRAVAVGTQLLETRPIRDAVEGRTSHVVLANIIYLVGGDHPLNFGYKYSTAGDRYHAHGFFMNANIRWQP
jgi:hypothetical protein